MRCVRDEPLANGESDQQLPFEDMRAPPVNGKGGISGQPSLRGGKKRGVVMNVWMEGKVGVR